MQARMNPNGQESIVAMPKGIDGPVCLTGRKTVSNVPTTVNTSAVQPACGNIVDALACPDAANIAFEPLRLDGPLLNPVEF